MLSNKLYAENLSLAVHTMHNIWLRMNDFFFQEKIKNPNTIAQKAIMEHKAYISAHARELGSHAFYTRGEQVVWKPLAEERIKFSWDAATQSKIGKVGLE